MKSNNLRQMARLIEHLQIPESDIVSAGVLCSDCRLQLTAGGFEHVLRFAPKLTLKEKRFEADYANTFFHMELGAIKLVTCCDTSEKEICGRLIRLFEEAAQ